jgi:hypothetical protein
VTIDHLDAPLGLAPSVRPTIRITSHRLVEIEAVGKVVGTGVGIPKRGEAEILFHEVQDAAKVMIEVRDMYWVSTRTLQKYLGLVNR